ncbi:MAG: PD40 domain-containing protein [Kofleriaceae bacterium]|nr:PD40 domain-containing protein [Myxococcales bacterium]MCB9559328.1 PD40 domain-containing protein [Kofleriaceae bacterium]
MSRLSVVAAAVLATAACGSSRRAAPPGDGGATAGNPRDGAAVAPADGGTAVVASPSRPALSADEVAALPGRILAAAGREGAYRVIVLDPAHPGPGRTLTPAGGSWFPAPTPVAMALHTIDAGDVHTEQLVRLGAGPDDATALGAASARVRAPTTTADGKVIVVESDARSFRDLYRIDPRTGAASRLTDDPAGNFEPSLSPDGKRVAFTSSRDGDAEIYVMDLGGGHLQRLTAFHRDDWGAAWSPDGAWIAFVSDREGGPRIFLVHPDGTGARHLHDGDAAGEELAPTWSPDGRRVAYTVSTRDGASEVWIADVAAATATRLSAPGARDEAPAWSPDGAHLVYASTRDRRIDLWIARADGTAESRLTDTPEEEWIPRWLTGAP